MSGQPPPQKYGLYVPPARKPAVRPAAAGGLFGSDDDDCDAGKPTAAQPDMKRRQAEKIQARALEEDPTVFLYDELLAEPAHRAAKARHEPDPPRPKYMEALLQRAAERKALDEVVRVRLMRKEAAVEADKFADKEVFVTAGYKRRLEDMKGRMEEEEALVEQDVTAQKDMGGFYSNLMTRNVAFGAGTGGRLHEQDKGRQAAPRLGAAKHAPSPQPACDSGEDEEFGPVRRQ